MYQNRFKIVYHDFELLIFCLVNPFRWPNAIWDAVSEGPPGTWGPSQPPGLYHSLYPSDVRTVREWSVCRPTHFRSGLPIVSLWLAAYRKIAATGALCGPLIHQGSWTTWAKPLRRLKKPPQPSYRPSPWYIFTQTHRSSHPESSRE